MSPIATINPATSDLQRKFDAMDPKEIQERLERSVRAFQKYRQTTFADRSRWLLEAAWILESRQEEFGNLLTLEMGKISRSSVEEVKKCARNCRYFAEHGRDLLKEDRIDLTSARGIVRYDPLGTILAIMPWNFPFWQVFRFAAPALMAGNTVVLKHASNVPQCALQIEAIFREAGFPEDVFQTLLVGSDRIGAVIEDDRIAAVTLTGSVEAGRSVGEFAGKAIKKTVLELGGSDPFIVMPSADLDSAVKTAVAARTINSGQSCVAAKRFIIAESIADEFEKKFVAAMQALRVGDPRDPATQIGPLATADILAGLDRQVRRSVEMGAKLLLGGKRLDRVGFYYAPTVLSEIPKGSPADQEELFGPVASLFRARDARHAVEIANSTRFGLGSCVCTQDREEQDFFASEIASGNVFFNHPVASDPRIPFGGIKDSGHGRELGVWGIREFVNIKAISILK